MKRNHVLWAALAATLVAGCAQQGDGNDSKATDAAPSAGKTRFDALRVSGNVTKDRIDARILGRTGQIDVWVSLEDPSVAALQASLVEAALAESADGDASRKGSYATVPNLKATLQGHKQKLGLQQAGLAKSMTGLGAQELARVQVAHNAIAVRIDASQIEQLAALPGVARVRPVINYELDLSETVPYVGASTVQAGGVDGTGVTVAVLDSGIDYTHRNIGGEGTLEAYAAAYGVSTADPLNTTRDGLFPTAKVVEGYDFVGEAWPNADLAPDPDPIDFEGHGTHVADIIAGQSTDGQHKGVAPGAKLLAVKVCSAVSSSCSGVALIQGVDYALDPNGDGDTSDAVDVINMSLGSPYGQIQDDLTLASNNAVAAGVVVVASAGNSADKPYIAGSPSIGSAVLSVAQTAVPSATAVPLVVNSPAALAGSYSNTQTLDWAPVGAGVTGDVTFVGRGCPAGSVPGQAAEDAYLTSPAGKVALIDRGGCSVSLKVDRAAKAGATGVIIGLVAGGDAVTFSFGGGDTFVPSLVIQQSLSTAIKTQLAGGNAVNVTISNAAAIPLVGSMASSSSRGPAYGTHLIKPEIGAPGASLSAEATTGSGETAFGGTSGAAPMVAGAAALMVQAHPRRSALQVKAMLMNSAETEIYTNPATVPGQLAPISRIGAGELRVDRAITLSSAAIQRADRSAALSFGALEVAATTTVSKTFVVQNFGKTTRSYSITPSFRYANDAASGAVQVSVPASVSVGPNRTASVTVQLTIDPSKLAAWPMDGGANGGNGALLNGPEFDGYLTLTDGTDRLSVPWHVLPRKAAQTSFVGSTSGSNVALKLGNTGADTGVFELFSLTGKSPAIPRTELPKPGDNAAVIDLRTVGVRYFPASVYGADYLEFAIDTYGRRSHPNYPAEFDVYIDTTGDGNPDFVVYNTENGGFGVSGQNVVFVANLATGRAQAFFFTVADLNSGTAIMTVPMAAMGLAPGTTIRFDVYAFDNYFTGSLTDAIEGMIYTPGKPRYDLGAFPYGEVAPGGSTDVVVPKRSVPVEQSSETGVLAIYARNAGAEAQWYVRGQ